MRRSGHEPRAKRSWGWLLPVALFLVPLLIVVWILLFRPGAAPFTYSPF